MRQIGTNQYVGIDNLDRLNLLNLRQVKSDKKKDSFSLKSPSRKFFQLLSERCRKPYEPNLQYENDYWFIDDAVFMEVWPAGIRAIEDSNQWNVFIRMLYVLDHKRLNGEGYRALRKLKKIADDSDCSMTFFIRPFVMTLDKQRNNAMLNLDDLWQSHVDGKLDVLYPRKGSAKFQTDFERMKKLYKRIGIKNCWLYNDEDFLKRERESLFDFENQFIYQPPNLSETAQQKIKPLLNKKMYEKYLSD